MTGLLISLHWLRFHSAYDKFNEIYRKYKKWLTKSPNFACQRVMRFSLNPFCLSVHDQRYRHIRSCNIFSWLDAPLFFFSSTTTPRNAYTIRVLYIPRSCTRHSEVYRPAQLDFSLAASSILSSFRINIVSGSFATICHEHEGDERKNKKRENRKNEKKAFYC